MIKRSIIATAIISMSPSAVLCQNIDPKTHSLCIEAKDYAGCIKSMKGDNSKNTVIDQVQRQEANLNEGNFCPAQHLYSGGGYCQRVICVYRGLSGKGHGQGLGGKNASCRNGAELTWDNNHQPIRASFEKKCPPGDFEIGFQSTCGQAKKKGYAFIYTSGFTRNNGYVEKVFGTPAKGNIKAGDRIVTINNMSPNDYVHNIHEPTTVLIVVDRNGQELEYSFKTKLQRVDM